MVILLSVLSIGVGLFVLVFTGLGEPSNVTNWIIGIAFLIAGGGGFYLNSQMEKQRQAKRKAFEASVRAHAGEWGNEFCEMIIERRIALDMTQEMVMLAWGRPNIVDEKEITKKGNKERWVYGEPRRNARYIWFADGKVSKIKT